MNNDLKDWDIFILVGEKNSQNGCSPWWYFNLFHRPPFHFVSFSTPQVVNKSSIRSDKQMPLLLPFESSPVCREGWSSYILYPRLFKTVKFDGIGHLVGRYPSNPHSDRRCPFWKERWTKNRDEHPRRIYLPGSLKSHSNVKRGKGVGVTALSSPLYHSRFFSWNLFSIISGPAIKILV